MTLRRALILLVATAALVAAAAGGVASSAAAQTPCWKRLINDWYDGRIDRAYPVSCYREAIRNLPEDVDAYTEAREDITRALLAAIRNSSSGSLDPTDVVPPQSGGRRGGRDGAGQPTDTSPPAETDPGNGETTGSRDDDDDDEGTAAPPPRGDDGGVLGVLSPSNADEVPLPLLVLAGLALLLLAAAAAGFVARRIQARKLRPATLPQRPGPRDS